MHARHKVFWLLSVTLLVFAGTLVLLNWRSLVAEREHLLAAAAQRTAGEQAMDARTELLALVDLS